MAPNAKSDQCFGIQIPPECHLAIRIANPKKEKKKCMTPREGHKVNYKELRRIHAEENLNETLFRSLRDARETLATWRQDYNCHRPLSALET